MMMRYFLLPVSLCLLLSSNALAGEDVSSPDAVDPSTIKESAPNLHKELGAPDSNVTIDVRSYERKDGAVITEYAVRGRVFKIKVQPSGGMPAYYLYDRDGDGTFEQRLPGGGKRISPPTWVLQEF